MAHSARDGVTAHGAPPALCAFLSRDTPTLGKRRAPGYAPRVWVTRLLNDGRGHPGWPEWAIEPARILAYIGHKDSENGRGVGTMAAKKAAKATGRQEEFGSTPWAGVAVAIMLAITVGGALAPHLAPSSQPAAGVSSAQISAPGAHLVSTSGK